MNNTLYIVSCGSKKADHSDLAKSLYIGNLFVAASGYAAAMTALHGRWSILSAAHGLIYPDSWIEPYDLTMAQAIRGNRRETMVARVRLSLEARIGARGHTHIEIHGGAAYAGIVREAANGLPVEVADPLQGKQIGERLRWYAERRNGVAR